MCFGIGNSIFRKTFKGKYSSPRTRFYRHITEHLPSAVLPNPHDVMHTCKMLVLILKNGVRVKCNWPKGSGHPCSPGFLTDKLKI
ncbi:unnamed protein product [Gulo gulo]|uniref:Uncharacterized protein n=1 Tax=Gulo gulo TaxID=48420 RepID=A0A9X9LUC0_GULGU|nr:unnamed protein product [Gulo gulo]